MLRFFLVAGQELRPRRVVNAQPAVEKPDLVDQRQFVRKTRIGDRAHRASELRDQRELGLADGENRRPQDEQRSQRNQDFPVPASERGEIEGLAGLVVMAVMVVLMPMMAAVVVLMMMTVFVHQLFLFLGHFERRRRLLHPGAGRSEHHAVFHGP